MSQADVLTILRDAIYNVIVCSAPMLVVAIVIGLIVSIFQATTQINEQTLAYAPKVVGVLLAVMFFGSMIMTRLSEFTTHLIESINVMIR